MGKSDLDQHFMVDRGLIKRIVRYSNLKSSDVVLEIGPGKGFLTRELVKNCKVVAVEKDKSFKDDLLKISRLNKNLEVKWGNVLPLISRLKFNKIVSNIPYNLSEPLLKKLFRFQPELVILTVSKSFADKVLGESTKIGLLTSLFFDVKLKEKVSRNSFLPRPKTDSAVIQLMPREEESFSTTDIVLRNFVLLDKKKTRNALMESLVKGLRLTKRKAKELIERLGLPETFLDKNSDLLSFEDFKRLGNSLLNLVK